MIFDKFNNTIPLVNEEVKAESVLYKPVKSLAVTLFPNFVKFTATQKEEMQSPE